MSMLNSGLRRTSPESLEAQQYAKRYQSPETKQVARAKALRVAKLAAAAMGLKSSKIALIDQLFACSKAVDWSTQGVSPIIWPSNARLARSMGIGVSTMKHHLNGLVRAGLIAYSDGPTYQRRGRRDKDGIIIEGYGIDLSPIAVRYDELSEMVEAVEYNAREWKRHSYRRTILRKEIQSLIFSAIEMELVGAWGHAQAKLDVIRETKPADLEELVSQVVALERMQNELEDIYDDMILDLNFNATVSKSRPIQTTPETPDFVYSRTNLSGRANAQHISHKADASDGIALEKKHDEKDGYEQHGKNPKQLLDEEIQYLSLPLMKSACPKLDDFVPGSLDSWADLRASGHEICVMHGINPQVWQEAANVLGTDLAIAALGVTVQKADLGIVESPGGYLRSLVQRGRDGDLRISRSLFALADQLGGETGSSQDAIPGTEPFPMDSTISYGVFGEIVREHAPLPTPNVDIVAETFRKWITNKKIDPTSPNIERIFTSFCRKFKLSHGDF